LEIIVAHGDSYDRVGGVNASAGKNTVTTKARKQIAEIFVG
jgi:hypothetical protein